MEDEREVRREDAAALAKFYNISYIETSSMRGINVEEAFRTITQEVYDKVNPPHPSSCHHSAMGTIFCCAFYQVVHPLGCSVFLPVATSQSQP